MLSISLVTLGDPRQLTGGYLYHQRMAEAAPTHGAEIRFVSFPDHPFPLPALRSRSVLKKASAADVVLLDSIAAAFAAPAVAWSLVRRPLVALVHQPPGGIDHGAARRRAQAVLDRLSYRRADVIVAASQALADEYIAGGFAPESVRVVPPGRDVAGSGPEPAEGLRRGRRAAVLCVGNWVQRKGIVALLDAVARLPAGAATLHLVGRVDIDQEYRRRVEARLAEPALAERVVVHGAVTRDRVAQLYGGADVFVLPSTREPYGTVYGEAMAAGLPVVGWRTGNLPHLATDDREGLLVEPGDIDGLASALGRLCLDETVRRRLATAARERAQSFPTWAESAASLFELLRGVAETDVDRRGRSTADGSVDLVERDETRRCARGEDPAHRRVVDVEAPGHLIADAEGPGDRRFDG
jgi:glycosyltransferase involved in cell wall biosynthesis